MRFPLLNGARADYVSRAEMEEKIAAAERRIHAEVSAKLDFIIGLLTEPRRPDA